MTRSLDEGLLAEASAALREANPAFARAPPGESPGRQPVHTVYGGAQLFAADSVPKLGGLARRALERYAPDPATLGRALGITDHPALETIHARVGGKLDREPIEDFRIDFEDGYGNRPDAEEDGHAALVAREVSKGMRDGTLPPFIGIRVKPLNEELRGSSIRTLDLVMTALVEAAAGGLPERWVVTIPKITVIEQVELTVTVLRQLERGLGLGASGRRRPSGALGGDDPQDHRDRAGRAHRHRAAAARAGARAGGRRAPLRGDGRDPADRSGGGRALAAPAAVGGVGRAAPRRALRDLRLRRRGEHPRRPAADAPPRL